DEKEESQANEIQQELAPEIDHPPPGILHFVLRCRLEDPRPDIVRNLIAQIIFNVGLHPLLVESVERSRFNGMVSQKFSVALIKLPKCLIRPLAIDSKLRR